MNLETCWKINVICVDVQQIDKYFKYTEHAYAFSERRKSNAQQTGPFLSEFRF
jgi:hypothetical protein